MTALLDGAQRETLDTSRPDVLYQTVIRVGSRPLRDARAIHRQVEHHTHPHRTLWAQPTPQTLVLRSVVPAVWSDWPGARSVHTQQCSAYHPVGARIAFSLVANPTRAQHAGLSSDGSPRGRGKRRGVESAEQARVWLDHRVGKVLGLRHVECERLSPARGARGLLLGRWAYSGTADVTDPCGLAELLTHGVGRGKAFGCGLLLVGGELRD